AAASTGGSIGANSVNIDGAAGRLGAQFSVEAGGADAAAPGFNPGLPKVSRNDERNLRTLVGGARREQSDAEPLAGTVRAHDYGMQELLGLLFVRRFQAGLDGIRDLRDAVASQHHIAFRDDAKFQRGAGFESAADRLGPIGALPGDW